MKNNERKFIDLIFRNNRGKYANLDPSAQVEAGNYGYIAKESGKFMKQGNIFDIEIVQPTDSLTKPGIGARIENMILMTEGTKNLGITGSAGACVDLYLVFGSISRPC